MQRLITRVLVSFMLIVVMPGAGAAFTAASAVETPTVHRCYLPLLMRGLGDLHGHVDTKTRLHGHADCDANSHAHGYTDCDADTDTTPACR